MEMESIPASVIHFGPPRKTKLIKSMASRILLDDSRKKISEETSSHGDKQIWKSWNGILEYLEE